MPPSSRGLTHGILDLSIPLYENLCIGKNGGIHGIAEVDADGSLKKSYTWGPGIDNLLADLSSVARSEATAKEDDHWLWRSDH